LHLRIDLHVHSVYSDGSGTVERILETAERKGMDGLVITDHDMLEGYYEAKACDSGLLVLPGFEAETDAGHVLVLGLELLPPYRVSYEDLIGWVRIRGGLSVLAHPGAGRIRLDRWMRCRPDAVEVLNASYPFSSFFLKRGAGVARRLGLPGVGGSDAHHAQTVGDAYTTVELNDPSPREVLAALKAGRASYAGRISPLSVRFKIGLGYTVSKVLKL